MGRAGRWQAWGVGGAGLALTGCLPLHEPLRISPEWSQVVWAGVGPAPTPNHGGLVVAGLGLLAVLGALAWLARRIFWQGAGEGGGQGAVVDREDMALLRTARQAMGFLLSKRLKQFKVVALADWLRGRGA